MTDQGDTGHGDTAQDEVAALNLLCSCLSFDDRPERRRELSARIAALGWEALLAFADSRQMGSILVHAAERLDLAPNVPMLTLADGRMTITKALHQRMGEHVGRRTVLAERLAEIAAALNDRGIVPIALKGGASIVTGEPEWRYLRDIDLLVPPPKAAEAQQMVQALGYRPSSQPRSRVVHHHLHELYRDDMPGWIEIHRRAGLSRVEQFLPTRELIGAAMPFPGGRVEGVHVLPAHLHVLQGMVHHHIGHRAVKRAEIDLKGLYEFAAGVVDMSDDSRVATVARAARHPRLLAILDLWTAAAADRFAMPVVAPLVLASDATEWWAKIRDGDGALTGTGPELRAATSPERMKRAIGGDSVVRRAYWRLTVPLTFYKRPMLMPGLS